MLRAGEGPVTNLAVSVGPLATGGRGPFVDPCAGLFVREISLGLPPGWWPCCGTRSHSSAARDCAGVVARTDRDGLNGVLHLSMARHAQGG